MEESALIAASELFAALGAPRLVIVDCRYDLANPAWGREEYLHAHVPGAVRADLATDLSGRITAASGRHPLPDRMRFASTCRAWGVEPDSVVVAYDQGNAAYAARLWWLLRASGHARVRVLNGGYAAWSAAGLPVSTAIPAPRRAPSNDSKARAFAGSLDSAAVQAQLAGGSALLIDARSAERFAGQNETLDPVAGHIPGAVNHPYTRNLQPDGRFLPAAQLRELWLQRLQGRPPTAVIAMCGSGVTACHNLLALELAGLHGARLYPGSFSAWVRDPARPVATGPDAAL